jgi:hypothetical protein
MTTPRDQQANGRAELEDDRRTERLIAWKGLLTVAVVVLIIVARQSWWIG